MLLALCLTAFAQDPEAAPPADEPTEATDEVPAEPAETDDEVAAEPAEADDEGWEAASEEVVDEVVDEAVEASDEANEQADTPDPDAGYRMGFAAGEEDAKRASDYALHGLAGFGAGCIIGPCGVAVPVIEAVVVPGVPSGPWQSFEDDYQKGYIDGYRKKVQRRRIAYSSAGAGVGMVLGVGAGLAFGLFI